MKNINKTYMIGGLTALAVAATFGLSQATLAANKTVKKVSGRATSTVAVMDRGHRGAKPELTATQKAEMEAQRTKMETQMKALTAALTANDYQAFKTALGTDNPLATKVTADNFSDYVSLYNLYQQQQAILTKLGFTKGNDNQGFGLGLMFGPAGHDGGHAPFTATSTSAVE